MTSLDSMITTQVEELWVSGKVCSDMYSAYRSLFFLGWVKAVRRSNRKIRMGERTRGAVGAGKNAAAGVTRCAPSSVSASAVVRWLVLPGLHECAGQRGRNRGAGERAGGRRKGREVYFCLPAADYERLSSTAALQTEGFDGFTLELWSQLGGNKKK